MANGGSLVVSIHDVAPPLLREVRYLLDMLDGIGARPRVLKVIPNLDGVHDGRADPAFVRLLAEEEAAGSEIVLHGYTHRAAGPARGPWGRRLRARLFAGPAAEFLSLDPRQTAERLVAGREALRAMGLQASGFCAPCWLAPPYLPRILRRCGFRYVVNMASVQDLQTDRRLWTPWFGYMGAGELQERLVGLGGWACAAVLSRMPALKVFFHPQGAIHSAACTRVVRRLAPLVSRRRLVTYAALVG
jgi:predicted deacetylase